MSDTMLPEAPRQELNDKNQGISLTPDTIKENGPPFVQEEYDPVWTSEKDKYALYAEVLNLTDTLATKEELQIADETLLSNIQNVAVERPTHDQMMAAIEAAGTGLWKVGGEVATRSELATAAPSPAEFEIWHIDDEDTDVYARTVNGVVTWQPLNFTIDLSAYALTTDVRLQIAAALAEAKSYTDSEVLKHTTGERIDYTVGKEYFTNTYDSNGRKIYRKTLNIPVSSITYDSVTRQVVIESGWSDKTLIGIDGYYSFLRNANGTTFPLACGRNNFMAAGVTRSSITQVCSAEISTGGSGSLIIRTCFPTLGSSFTSGIVTAIYTYNNEALTAPFAKAFVATEAPATYGNIAPPEVFTYTASNTTHSFTLHNTPKFATEVMVLGTDTFTYLQEGDYNIEGDSLTVSSPALTEGDKVKIVYAV